MAQLPAFLVKAETEKKNYWSNDHPKPDQPPRLDMTEDEALAWLRTRLDRFEPRLRQYGKVLQIIAASMRGWNGCQTRWRSCSGN